MVNLREASEGILDLKEKWLQPLLIHGLMAISFFIAFGHIHNLLEYGFFTLLLIWTVSLWMDRRLNLEGLNRFQRTSLDYPILFFLVWILVTIPWAIDPAYSFSEWRKTLAKILMFYFVVNVVKTPDEVKKILNAFLLGLVTLSVIGLVIFLSDGRYYLFHLDERLSSWTSGSQWFSTFLLMAMPFWAFSFTFESKLSLRACYGIGFAVTFVALLATNTRAAYLAVLAQGGLYLLLRHLRSGVMISGIVILSFGLFMGSLFFLSQHPSYSLTQLEVISSSVNGKQSRVETLQNMGSMQRRFATWSIALEDFLDNPLTGLGYGQRSFEMQHLEIGHHEFILKNVHISFLQKLVQSGVPGALLFALIFMMFFRTVFEVVKWQSRSFDRGLALSSMAMVLGVMVRNMFDDMFLGNLVYLFWLLLGLTFCLGNEQKGKGSS